jgi:sugar lactone lactonase YvrE
MHSLILLQTLAIDANDNLYVTDILNFRIRKITPDGTVTTIAGSTKGFTDGIGSSAQFTSPQDVVVADSNTLLVADGYAVRVLLI